MSDIADKIYAATGLTLGAEAAAAIGQMIQQARRDALKEAAQVADKHAHGSDKKFAEVVRKASAAGNIKIFVSGAPSVAGMDDAARKIAAAIRALGEKE